MPSGPRKLSPQDDDIELDQPSPEQVMQERLARENEQLRRRVDALERTVKSAQTLFRYVSDPPAKQLKNASRASWTKWK
jgi:hypothetical protein